MNAQTAIAAPAGEPSRTYEIGDVVCFRKTREAFGGLSNMAPGFPILVGGVFARTSEALYQACRFPHLPGLQRQILAERSPMTAKMRGKPHRQDSRPDWDCARIPIMRWCLRAKLAANWSAFGELLVSTGGKPIVESSDKDDFWGAKPDGTGKLIGGNVLGRLLMELRDKLEAGSDRLRNPLPPKLPQFLLLGEPIGSVEAAITEPSGLEFGDARNAA